MRCSNVCVSFLLCPLLTSALLCTPRFASRPGSPPSAEVDVSAAMAGFRNALAAGDSARARAAFTPSAWILDETERPRNRRPVGQAGCRGWCRPAPPLHAYQLEVLPDSAAALAVETYRAASGVDPAPRRQKLEYTVVSVLTQQGGRWRISAQTLYRRPGK